MWGLSTPLSTRTCVVAASTAPSGRDRYQKDSELHLRRILCSSKILINQQINQYNQSIYQYIKQLTKHFVDLTYQCCEK